MAADVPPWPAIETTFLNMRDVIGHKVVTHAITFVYRAPQLSRRGIYCQPATGITDAICVHSHPGAIGIELQDIGAILFIRRGIGVVDIRRRSDSDEHLLTVRCEPHVAGPVSGAMGKVNNVLRRCARLQVPISIRKPDDCVAVA